MNKQLVILFFLITAISCRKKGDEIYPSVEFLSPATNSVHQIPNPVNFSVRATDETNLESITVHLLNNNYVPIATSVSFTCNDNDETFSSFILPSDIHLSTGIYYLKAIARDGFNEKVVYKEIYLLELPRSLHSVWISKNPNSSLVEMDSLNGNSFINAYSFSSDQHRFEVNSYYGLLHSAGGNTGSFYTYQLNNTQPLYTITNTGAGNAPFFTSVAIEANKTFVADRSGKIKSFQKNAQPNDLIDIGNFYAEAMDVSNDRIHLATVNSTGTLRAVQTYFIQSGILADAVTSTLETVQLFAITNNEILLFGNETGQGKIKLYNVSQSNLSEPVIFTGGIIYDVADLGNNLYAIAHSNGVEIYDHSGGNLTSLLSGNSFQLIKYEDLNGKLFLARNNQLDIYNLSPFTLENTIAASDSITGIGLLYNK